jgi:hypothetical protein
MMQLLAAIENSGFATWVRESPSMFAYTGLLFLHALGLALTVGVSWVIGLRILGVARGLPLAPMEGLFPVIFVGFWINALSGMALLASAATKDGTSPIFLTKMAFVLLGIVTMRLVKMRVFGNPAMVNADPVPRAGRILAGVSIAVWALAIVAGRLNEYPQLFGLRYH